MTSNTEDRRLKIGGLMLAVAGVVPLGWVIDRIEHNWPPAPDVQLTWLLAAVIGMNVMAAGLLLMATGFGKARPAVDTRRRRAVLVQLVVANLLLPVIFLGNLLDRPASGAGSTRWSWRWSASATCCCSPSGDCGAAASGRRRRPRPKRWLPIHGLRCCTCVRSPTTAPNSSMPNSAR